MNNYIEVATTKHITTEGKIFKMGVIMPKLKTNEQITEEFDALEVVNLKLLKKEIIKHTEALGKCQREYKKLTGKKYYVF